MVCDISQIVISAKHVPIRIAYKLLLYIQIHYYLLYYITTKTKTNVVIILL